MVNYRGDGEYDEGTRIFALPAELPDDSFALRGTWAVDYQGITAQNDDNAIALNYHARNVYMVVGGTGTVTVTRGRQDDDDSGQRAAQHASARGRRPGRRGHPGGVVV